MSKIGSSFLSKQLDSSVSKSSSLNEKESMGKKSDLTNDNKSSNIDINVKDFLKNFNVDEGVQKTVKIEDSNDDESDNKLEVLDYDFLKKSTNKIISIGLCHLPEQTKKFCQRKGCTFTLMVAGLTSTGKTTFINTLFGTHLLSPFITNLNTITDINKITCQKFVLEEEGFELKFSVIDTPGFGQCINNQYSWIPICNYIDEQFRFYLFQSEQPDRKKLVDSRVHCCLYFIYPTGSFLTPLDIEAMKELSKRVNLIPIIGKSDTLNNAELIKFKNIVKNTLTFHNIDSCSLINDQNVLNKIYSSIPFAIIGSDNSEKNAENKFVRGRKYKWGVAEVENNKHCDFVLLREILMSDHMLDLISSTEIYYENYRHQCLFDRLFETSKLSNLDPDTYKSGLEQLQLYHSVSFEEIENKIKMYDPIYEIKEKEIKKKFSVIVANEEKKFKEWKKDLIEKQELFNRDIEKQYSKLIKLQEHIDFLTSGNFIKSNNHHKDKIDTENKSILDLETESFHNSEISFT